MAFGQQSQAVAVWRGIAAAEFVLLCVALVSFMHTCAHPASCPACPAQAAAAAAAAATGGASDCPPCLAPACPACPMCEQSETKALVAAATPSTAASMKLGCLLRDPASGALLEAGGDFMDRAGHFGISDKVTDHKYQGIYAKYLDRTAAADIDVVMLEIGLGCDMSAGPGGSVEMWRAFFGNKNLKLHVLEYVKCMEKWEKTIAKLKLSDADVAWYEEMKQRVFWGSQDDRALLKEVRDTLKEVDVVVDDGSHRVEHQIASFEEIFPIVKPGGVYFIEDLETSFYEGHGAKPEKMRNMQTAVGYLMRLMRDLQFRPEDRKGFYLEEHIGGAVPLAAWVRSIDCDRGVCAITKRATRFVPPKRAGPNWAWPCEWRCGDNVDGRTGEKTRRCQCLDTYNTH